MRDVQKPRPLVRAYRAMRSRSRAVLTRKKRDQPKDKPLGGTLTLDDSDDMNDSLGGEEREPEQSEEATEQSSDDCTRTLLPQRTTRRGLWSASRPRWKSASYTQCTSPRPLRPHVSVARVRRHATPPLPPTRPTPTRPMLRRMLSLPQWASAPWGGLRFRRCCSSRSVSPHVARAFVGLVFCQEVRRRRGAGAVRTRPARSPCSSSCRLTVA